MKNKITLIISTIIFVFLISCNDKDDLSSDNTLYSKGSVFIINEGNFTVANSSLYYYRPDSNKVVNNIFQRANNAPLGDVAQSMIIHDDKAFITINNSGHIYITDVNTSKFIGKISGLLSPREMLVIDETKAYITDLYSKSIYIANLQSYEVIGSIPIGKSTENIVMANNKVFVSNWSSYPAVSATNNNTVMVIDPDKDIMIDSITVGIEPVSMVVDELNKLWVLCSGGYLNEENPTLWKVNTSNYTVEEKYYFDNKTSSPDNLCINGTNDKLYFINQDIFEMSVYDDKLPETPLIESGDKNFYALGINPENTEIYASDALDYSHFGTIYRYSESGELITSFKSGIIPGYFCFY